MINETTSFITGFVAEKTTTYLHFGFVDSLNALLLRIPLAPWISVAILSFVAAWFIVTRSRITQTILIAIIGSLIFLILRFVLGLGLL